METQSEPRVRKTSKKGSKSAKAKSAEEEGKRREVVKEALRGKLDLEQRALQVVERLLEDSVPDDFLVDCAKFITPTNYKDVIEERSIDKLCGYPICENKLDKVPTQQFKISTKTNKVYDITERKCFCSNFCCKASKEYELKISTTPLWLRIHESPPQITLMKKGDGGSSGEELRIAARCLQEEDIENPAAATTAIGPSDPQHPGVLGAPARSTHSEDSDEGEQDQDQEQEQGFVSSMVAPGPRVHWGELPVGDRGRKGNREKENEERRRQSGDGDLIVTERGESGGDPVVCTTENAADVGVALSVAPAHTQEEKEEEKKVEEEEVEKSSADGQSAEAVEEAVGLLNSCRIAEQLIPAHDTHADTAPLQGRPLPAEHSAPVGSPPADATGGEPRAGSPQTLERLHPPPPPTPGPDQDQDVTQVGMSKKGAAGLRELLLLHRPDPAPAPVQPQSVRENLVEHLRGTLNAWRSDKTRTFLYGPDHAHAPHPGGQEENDEGLGEEEEEEEEEEDEDELDEDDLEAEVAVGGRVRPSAPAPDYDTLRRQTQEQELRVHEFYQGSWATPGDPERSPALGGDREEEREATAQGPATADPLLPLVDSQSQILIQKRIVVDKLTRSLRDIVGPLGLTMTHVSADLNNLVRTFSFTSTNIIHRAPEWTLIAVVLLHLLAEVSAAVREALGGAWSVQHVDARLRELSVRRADLAALLQLFRSPALH